MDENSPTVDTPIQPASAGAAQSLMALERLIINYLADIERQTNELKKQKEMLENILINDAEYKEAADKAKAAGKEKATVKANILNRPEAATLAAKVNEFKKELNEKRDTFSKHLQEYGKLSGTNQFEDDEGQVREIVFVAKLVKRSNRFRT